MLAFPPTACAVGCIFAPSEMVEPSPKVKVTCVTDSDLWIVRL
jgi:hypothetical protein